MNYHEGERNIGVIPSLPWKLFLCFVFLFSVGLALIPTSAQAAVVYVLPASQDVYEGDTFIAQVRLGTEGVSIQEIDVQGVYPADKLEVVDVFLGGSAVRHADFFSNQGEIAFTGQVQNELEGDELIAYIVFLAKEQGSAPLRFQSVSEISPTEREFLFLEGNYTVTKRPKGLPDVSSPSHKEQTKWHRGTTLRMHVDLREGSVYSYLLTRDPQAQADDMPDRPAGNLAWIGDMEYAWLDSAIHYFHIRECAKQSEGSGACLWGPQTTFRAMIDGTAPEEFIPRIENIDGSSHVVFATIDSLSGIDRYEVAEEHSRRFFGREAEITERWLLSESPYMLEDQTLRSTVLVKAVDRAGNERIAEIVPARKFSLEDVWSLLLLAVLVTVVLGGWRFISRKGVKP